MGKRISPATAISLVALFFSIAGAGLAASRYLITSTRQISPSVLRALRGQRGLTGVRGPAGPPGQQGTPGVTGSPGPVGSKGDTGPSGAWLPIPTSITLTVDAGSTVSRCSEALYDPRQYLFYSVVVNGTDEFAAPGSQTFTDAGATFTITMPKDAFGPICLTVVTGPQTTVAALFEEFPRPS